MASGFHIIDDGPEEPTRDEDRLDLRRIKVITQARRAEHRRLLWAQALLLVFAGLTILTAIEAIGDWAEPSRGKWLLLVSVLCLLLAIRAAYRLRRLKAPPKQLDLPRPDRRAFDSLGDGSQHARGLDELARDREN